MEVNLRRKSNERIRVLAARSGERVEAIILRRERRRRIKSRFHKGQFCEWLILFDCWRRRSRKVLTYEGIVGVIARLWV